jgi:hypothetical protein
MQTFKTACFFFVFVLISSVGAQVSDTLHLPPGLVIPNYNKTPIGFIGASEGGAFVARATGPASNWYNPAGLATADSLSVNAGFSGYDIIKLKLDGFKNEPRSLTFNGVPGFIGLVTPLSWTKARIGVSYGSQSSWQPIFDTDTKLNTTDTNDQMSIAYRLKFSTSAPGISLGFNSSHLFRWGVGIQFPFTSINLLETIGEQILHPASISSNLVNFRVSGLNIQFAGLGGVQYILSDNVTLGASVRTPGLNLYNNAQISYESLRSSNDSTESVVFHDNSAKFNYHLPFQFTFGVAYESEAFQVELDMMYYSGSKPYTVLGSDEQFTRYLTAFEQPFSVQYLQFPDLKFDRRQLVNTAIGGFIKVKDIFRIHGGVFTDLSPVSNTGSDIFRKINLYGATVGLSVRSKNLAGGAGFIYSFGRSDSFVIGNFPTGQTTTHLNVNSFTLVWAIGLVF